MLLFLVSFQFYMHSGKLWHSEDREIGDQAEKEDQKKQDDHVIADAELVSSVKVFEKSK